jgi:polyhydroxybutyrate depolymerase
VTGRVAGLLALAIAVAACRTTPSAAPPAADTERAAAAAVAALPSTGCRSGTLPATLVGERRTVIVDGLARSYLLDAAGGPADQPRPLVLAFHGFGHFAAGLRANLGFPELAARGELVAIHAEGRDGVKLLNRVARGWDIAPEDTTDVAFVRALLDDVERERCIDRRRIFATGFSNGGFLANLLGCQLADRLAAVASVAGGRALDACAPAMPMPILFFHGTADQVVPLRMTAAAAGWWRRANHCAESGDDELPAGCEAARDCAADVVVCKGSQQHVWPADATNRIWEFFQAHPRRADPR